MTTILPPALPRLSPSEVRSHLVQLGVTDAVAVLALPGYYLTSMGHPAKNDRGLYDDALFVASPNGVVAFNGNTDPSIYRPGIATLNPGVWRYKPGIHGLSRPAAQRYAAFVQAAPVTVSRDGAGEDTGWFGINIHRGSNTTTSSLGCQTVPPDQWGAFHALVNTELKRHGQKTFPYALKAPADHG